MRRRQRLLAVAAVALLLAGCQQQQAKDTVQDLTGSAVSRDGGRINVEEYGFTPMPTASGSPATGPGSVEVAVVLQNTSKTQQAQTTDVVVGLYDAQGRLLFGSKKRSGDGDLVDSPAIDPGARAAFGFKLSGDDATTQGTKPVRMQVTVGNSDWVLPHRKPALVTTGTKLVEQADGSADLTFNTQVPDLGTYANQQSPRLSLLFRDSGGKLLGGYAIGRESLPAWTVGTNDRHVHFTPARLALVVPPGADLTKTAVHASIDGG